MRIIAGIAKGRKLKTLQGAVVRPTSDKVRGAIFNILGEVVVGASVLDLFSGSGALGIEALSRGAKSAVFVDNDIRCVNIIRENLKNCKFSGEVIREDVYKVFNKLEKKNFNIVFADPPYGLDLAKNLLSQLDKNSILKDFCIIVIEHSKRDEIEEPSPWIKIQQKRYGETTVSFYKYEKYNCNISGNI